MNPAQTAPTYAGAGDDPMLAARGGPHDALARGKRTLPLDLKTGAGCGGLLDLVRDADVVISEMRPGKLDALGLGWDTLGALNPRLILCEISGYGRTGPLAERAGHDIDYLARSGALSLIRDRTGRPVVPQNIIGDYAAGGSLAVSAILAALIERGRTGRGRRIDVSMTDGIRYLMSDIAAATLLAGHPSDTWRATLNGGMPTYDVYRAADGGWMAVGALEPKFIAILAGALDWPELSGLMEHKASWEEARSGLRSRFAARTRAEWTSVFDPLDACVSPVLELDELPAGEMPDIAGVCGAGAAP